MVDGTDNETQSWGLVLAFDDESPSFVHGFEAGQVFALMEAGQSPIERTVHCENEALFRRMSGRMGYDLQLTKTDVSGWLDLSCVKARPARHLYPVGS